MSDVCLVQMPYTDLVRPSMALSLLKTYLTQHQISSTVLYANLDFAHRVGVDVYKAIEETPPDSLVGEWTFAKAAFPEGTPDPDAFLAPIREQLSEHGWFKVLRRLHGPLDYGRLLTAVRDDAPDFIDRMARQIVAAGPRIVGCTSTFQQHCASLALLRRIKQLAPSTVTMLGGANCEGAMGETTHRLFPWLDFVMSGEVDAFFGGFCRTLLTEGLDAADRHAPEGVFGRRDRERRRMRLVTPRAVLHSLDDAAVPDFDDYFHALSASPLAAHIQPGLVFESSRGCWWGMKHHCTFCGLNGEGMVFRSKSADRVVDEVMALRRKYGVEWLQAVDNIIDAKHLQTVLPRLVEYRDRPYLFYEVKANLRRDHVKLLSDAGVRQIQPGIESMHDEVLHLLDKGNRWFTNVQLLKWSQEAGIKVSWNFLAGAPGERDEWYCELAEWLPALFHLEPPESSNALTIRYDRFSVYHNTPEAFGLTLVPNAAYARVYPVDLDGATGLAYFFEDARAQRRERSMGHRALDAAVTAWRQAFDGDDAPFGPARLLAADADGDLVVRDTRPTRTAAIHTLSGVDRAVLLACDTARTSDGVFDAVRKRLESATREQVARSLDRLRAAHLVLDVRGQLLSLPVYEPVTPYVNGAEVPGLVNLSALLRTPRDNPLVDAALDMSALPQDEWLALATEAY
jgi:ribosomal peptide maturation radical SAM protein 1